MRGGEWMRGAPITYYQPSAGALIYVYQLTIYICHVYIYIYIYMRGAPITLSTIGWCSNICVYQLWVVSVGNTKTLKLYWNGHGCGRGWGCFAWCFVFLRYFHFQRVYFLLIFFLLSFHFLYSIHHNVCVYIYIYICCLINAFVSLFFLMGGEEGAEAWSDWCSMGR
jgi:hypothetical protein